jgi:hypothetical protein
MLSLALPYPARLTTALPASARVLLHHGNKVLRDLGMFFTRLYPNPDEALL